MCGFFLEMILPKEDGTLFKLIITFLFMKRYIFEAVHRMLLEKHKNGLNTC
jgi:hypothetical protein